MAIDSTPVEIIRPETLPEFVEETGENAPQKMKIAVRREEIFAMKLQGYKPAEIAELKGISVATVYNDLKAVMKDVRERITSKDSLDLITENITLLEEVERIAMREASLAESTAYDPKSGRIIKVDKDKDMKPLLVALRARELIMKLQLDTGMVAREAQELNVSINGRIKLKEEKREDKRSEEEIKRDILKLLKNGRQLSAG